MKSRSRCPFFDGRVLSLQSVSGSLFHSQSFLRPCSYREWIEEKERATEEGWGGISMFDRRATLIDPSL